MSSIDAQFDELQLRDRVWRPIYACLQRASSQVFEGHTDSVESVALGTIDGEAVIVSGSGDGTVRLWRLDGSEPDVFEGHTGIVRSVALGTIDSEAVIVSGSWDRTVRLWRLDGSEPAVAPMDAPTTCSAAGDLVAVGFDRSLAVLQLY